MTLSYRIVTFFILSLTILLSGCGWQLRGYHNNDLSISSIALDSNQINNPMFLNVFKDTMGSEYNIQISRESSVKATITNIDEKKRVSSKDRNGDTSEYQHTVTVSISTTLNNQSLTQNFSSIARQSHDEGNILSSDMQERATKRQTYQEITRQYASYLAKQLINSAENK